MVKIELKSIKHAAFASQETHAYEGTLYVDGVRWGVVGNDGHGGPDHFHGDGGRNYGDLMALNERIAAEYPRITYKDGDEDVSMANDLECVCGDLVNQFLRERRLKALLGKTAKINVLYFKEPPIADGAALYQVSMRTHPIEVWTKHILSKHPNAVIVNTLPKEEAMKVLALAA